MKSIDRWICWIIRKNTRWTIRATDTRVNAMPYSIEVARVTTRVETFQTLENHQAADSHEFRFGGKFDIFLNRRPMIPASRWRVGWQGRFKRNGSQSGGGDEPPGKKIDDESNDSACFRTWLRISKEQCYPEKVCNMCVYVYHNLSLSVAK